MTFSKIAGGLLLLVAFAATTQATGPALRALSRRRRSGFCDMINKQMDCAAKSPDACTGDCAVDAESKECSINPAVAMQSMNMMTLLAPMLACGLGGAAGEESCTKAGDMCEWVANDEGSMMCSVKPDKLVQSMGNGDPVMGEVLGAAVTCSRHGASKCTADSNCEYDGSSCNPNMMSFMSKCASKGSANKCSGLTKLGDMYLPCAGLEESSCSSKSGCEYDADGEECGPGGAEAMKAMVGDSDIIEAQKFISGSVDCEGKSEEACKADSQCEASVELVKRQTQSQNADGSFTASITTEIAKGCDTNVKALLESSGCGGGVMAMFYKVEAAQKKNEAKKAKALKEQAVAKKAELVKAEKAANATLATKKAAYEKAKKALDACGEGCDSAVKDEAAKLKQEFDAATTAQATATAAVKAQDTKIADAEAAEKKLETDAAAADTNAAEAPASRVISSAVAVFAAAAAAVSLAF